LLWCHTFKQEAGDGDDDPAEANSRKRGKGPLYKLKAAIQGLARSRSAAAEVYGGEYQYQRVVKKAEEIFFSVSTALASACESLRRAPPSPVTTLICLLTHTPE
jgi:chlorophyll(ide) b reductase